MKKTYTHVNTHIQAPHITTATALAIAIAIATITLYKLAPEPFLKNRTEVCSFFFFLSFFVRFGFCFFQLSFSFSPRVRNFVVNAAYYRRCWWCCCYCCWCCLIVAWNLIYMQIFHYTHITLSFGVNIRVLCTIVNHLKHFDLLFRNLVGGFQFFFFISFHLIVLSTFNGFWTNSN